MLIAFLSFFVCGTCPCLEMNNLEQFIQQFRTPVNQKRVSTYFWAYRPGSQIGLQLSNEP